MITPQEAVEMVNSLSQLFAVTSPGLCLDDKVIEDKPQILAALIVDEDMIVLRSELIHPRLIAHEIGHHVYHAYNDWSCPNPKMCEAWAQYFEVMWMADGFRFKCDVCYSRGPVRMLETGDVMCLSCGSIYGIDFY